MGGLGGPKKTPATFGSKVVNIGKNHFRGLIGGIGLIAFFGAFARPLERTTLYNTVLAVWATMLWFIIWQPVPIQATGMFVIFAFPMMGILSSENVCNPLFNEQILLMFIGTWILMLLNCSGIDKRVACFFMCFDDSYTSNKVICKSMMAAFFLSIISNRFLVVPLLIDMLIKPLDALAFMLSVTLYNVMYIGQHENPSSATFDFVSFKGVLCSAISTSSTLGSLCIIHNNLITLQFKAMFTESAPSFMEFPDVFNYLQYSAFAFPTMIPMFILNCGYHLLLARRIVVPDACMTAMRKSSKDARESVGKWNLHQGLSVFFFILITACFFTRWSTWLNMGWANFRESVDGVSIPVIKDATTAAIFALGLHLIPKSTEFLTSGIGKKNRELEPPKVESGLLFWKTIDNNTHYALFFIMGAGIILISGVRTSGLDTKIASFATDNDLVSLDLKVALLLVGLITVVGANVMNGIGWQAMLVPFIIHLSNKNEWQKYTYLFLLIMGIGCSFGFMTPFQYTTGYFTRENANVPLTVQMKYGFASVIICFLVLYVSVAFYVPLLCDPSSIGVLPVIRL